MSNVPPNPTPSATPTPTWPRGVGVAFGILILVIIVSLFRVSSSAPLARIHPAAITKAMVLAQTADNKGHGTATMYDVSNTASKDKYGALMDNLGQLSGNPRAVQYNIYVNSEWDHVCVVLPVGGYPIYPVTCPGV
jgi:hypothetical protein